ncbi:MAG TPA: hypothetical protein VFR33_16235 [Candidatus Dormibacteraeota bacterium]|nr:hypothetical protein [Candidatus Dormibacteraeota bacterium]
MKNLDELGDVEEFREVGVGRRGLRIAEQVGRGAAEVVRAAGVGVEDDAKRPGTDTAEVTVDRRVIVLALREDALRVRRAVSPERSVCVDLEVSGLPLEIRRRDERRRISRLSADRVDAGAIEDACDGSVLSGY